MAKAIFGHYMGSFAPGFGAIQYHALNGLVTLDAPAYVQANRSNLAAWAATTYGGTYRNFALAPQSRTLSMMEAAELEIKRAIRIGMDGFTFDAWAGGKNARDLLDAMFTICETQDLPFELTITLDTASMNHTDADIAVYPGNVWEKTLGWLIDRHGSSPKLARRDGKVMIMGYQSIWPGQYAINQHVEATMPSPAFTSTQRNTEKNRLRTSEEGWQMIVDAYAAMEVTIGVPIYWEFCLNAFYIGTTGGPPLATAAAFLAQHFPALGLFEWVTNTPAIAAAVIAEGAEWSHPMKLQYENYSYYQAASTGLNWIRGDWNYADTLPSTLIQHITWNDYHETTNLSPGYNTRYAYYALTKHFIAAWKADAFAPDVATSDHDEIYIFSHKYAHNTPMFPFKAVTRADNVIEVLSILPTSAKIRVQGRTTTLAESEWTAAAGMDTRQLPLTPGPVVVEWSRDNFVSDINTLTLPEPISDKPFRQDTGKVAISTECAGQWAIDFPSDGAMLDYSEYADADGDGLPNWFEMLWFGTFGKISTQTSSIASSDPWSTGKTLLQHFQDQTDPYGEGSGDPPDPPLPDPDPDPEPDPPPPTPDGDASQYYVLGTFNSLFEALTDFEGHALLVTFFQIPSTGTEDDVLDREAVCGVSDDTVFLAPPGMRATAWAEAEATALLHVHCANPLDCPELDRVPIRSHGCAPPPNCIAEPDALTALVANPTCAVPTFLPPSSPRTRLTQNLNFGYATATAVAYDMSFEDASGLVNYIEIPFFQENIFNEAVPPTSSIRTVSRFKGLVRLWESGTVEIVGEVTTTDPAFARDFRVATGATTGEATYRVVGTAPISGVYPNFGAWQAVDWSYRLAPGEKLFLVVEPSTLQVDVLAYPGGWQLPFDTVAAAAGAVNEGTVSRSGNDLVAEGSFTDGGITSAQMSVWSYTMDTSIFVDENQVFHTSGSTTGPWGPFTKAIPDSPTNGALFEIEVFAGTGTFETGSRSKFGPIFREAYSTPTIQQGIDPEA